MRLDFKLERLLIGPLITSRTAGVNNGGNSSRKFRGEKLKSSWGSARPQQSIKIKSENDLNYEAKIYSLSEEKVLGGKFSARAKNSGQNIRFHFANGFNGWPLERCSTEVWKWFDRSVPWGSTITWTQVGCSRFFQHFLVLEFLLRTAGLQDL